MTRPDTLPGFTSKVETGYGSLYLTINELDEKPYELFAVIGKSGASTQAKTEAIGRLVSLAFKKGATPIEIAEQLIDISGENPKAKGDTVYKSIPDAIGQVLMKKYKGKEEIKSSKKEAQSLGV